MESVSTQLFQQHLELAPSQRLLTLGVAPELAAAWAARVESGGRSASDLAGRGGGSTAGFPTGQGGETWAVWDMLPDVQTAERLAEQQRLQAFHPLHAGYLGALIQQRFDVCILDAEQYPNRSLLLRLLWQAAVLTPAGMFSIAGANDGGIQSLEKRLRDSWGQVEVVAYKKGHRLLRVPRPLTLRPLAEPLPGEQAITLRGQTLTLSLQPGVFAEGGLDPATARLSEVMQVGKQQRILDLGCGSGVLGMLAARLSPASQVTLVDASALALDIAQENCQRNDLERVQALASDGVAAVRKQQFDLVLCNPPFHQGHTQTTATALRFICEAREVLAPRGRLYLVANRFLGYESEMYRAFGNVTRVREDTRYKVLVAERRATRA
jgi:16S rRNA (guanine1207-N2)-methyltransferase